MDKNTLVFFAALSLLTACGRDDEPAPEAPPPPATPPTGVPAEPPVQPLPGEPAAPPTEPPAVPPATPQSEAPAAPAGEAPPPAATADAERGASVYKKTCALCHAAGVAGAPKPGDTADWSPRIAQGTDVLYNHALNGFQGAKGVMPPKGGNTELPDEDVRAAVDYMVAQSK
jgi:cytochrome c5